MQIMKLKLTYLAALAMLLTACVKQQVEPRTSDQTDRRVRLSATIQQPVQTLVSTGLDYTTSFSNGDQIGVYAVSRKTGEVKALAASDNYADNVLFTFNGTAWESQSDMLYPQGDSVLDLYAYYPYRPTIADATDIDINVQANQSIESNYNTGDILWDSATAVTAQGRAAELRFTHRTALVELQITGSDVSLIDPSATVTTKLLGGSPAGKLNLTTGVFAATAGAQDITMLNVEDNASDKMTFRALVPIQSIPSGVDLFEVAVSDFVGERPGKTYQCRLATANTLEAGKVACFEFAITAPAIPSTPVVLDFQGVAFASGNQVGVWVESSATSGIYDKRVATYDGTDWSLDTPLNYPDDGSTLTFYAYYPYNAGYNTITAIPFNVPDDQSSHNAATPAALYWKKSDPAAKSASPIAITLGAIQIADITLELLFSDGSGFDPGDLDQTGATIPSMQTNGSIDLTSGAITSSGATSDVKMAYSETMNDEAGNYTVRLFARLPSGQSVPSGEGAFTIQGPYSTSSWNRVSISKA